MNLPSGTVTFLFTDIEGSTKLWEAHPEAMRPALARHDTLLRGAITDNGGYVFKTVGDAFCAAFPTAPDALKAALEAQLALSAEPWGLPTPLRVRMALHMGSAQEREGDYFGPPLNRVARLMAAGHGGQTLLSLAAQELTRDALPASASLLDLGSYRLKDLWRPETVFQLLHPSLPAEFPPLKSLDNPALPNNLPQQPTSFIGREKELGEIKALLGKTRLLTLTGSGGSGKTRLSLQAAAEILDGSGDGVWLVELAALADPQLVPQTVAGVFGLKEDPGKPITQTLTGYLKSKRLMLVLDNCEHLLNACASLADAIIRNCPNILILASSREGLGIGGELTYRVPSLSLPDPKQAVTPEALSAFESVKLFVERAEFHQPQFEVTNANAPALASICHRLDGIPLAIELAAARARSLSVEEINNKLDQRFRLLTGGSRTALPRQQTLRSLIDWSFDLLSEAEKALLCRLSVFAGGWTLEACEKVCTDDVVDEFDVLDFLTSLCDKSLVVPEEHGGTTRYRLLETVRQYSRDRLLESSEGEVWRDRHLAFFTALAEEAEGHLNGPDQVSWLSRLESEHDNLRASLSWCLPSETHVAEEGFTGDAGLRLAGALWRFWFVRGHLSEGRRWLTLALASGREISNSEATASRSRALNGAGTLALSQGDFFGARALSEESLTLSRQFGNQQGIADALINLGIVVKEEGDPTEAHTLYEESLTLSRQLGNQQGIADALKKLGNIARLQADIVGSRAFYEESLTLSRQLGDQGGIADTLGSLGWVAFDQGDYPAARALYEESLTLSRQLGSQVGIAVMLKNLGNVAAYQGDYPAARALYEESLTLSRQLGSQVGIANTLLNIGIVAKDQGDYVGSRALYGESLTLYQQMGSPRGIFFALSCLGVLAHKQNQMGRAARLSGAAASLLERTGYPLNPVDQEEVDTMLASAREALGEAAFTTAWEAGRAMTPDEAVEYALREGDDD